MNWWTELYDDDIADLLLERRGADELEALAASLIDLLELAPGDRVLDQCCGTGPIARALLDRGLDVVGVDQAARYIDRARERAPEAELVCADAAAFVAAPRCRAALNWATSFGYALRDEDNQAMLRAAFESLEPGGLYALDVLSLPGVLRNFQKTMVDRDGDRLLIRETAIDLAAGLMNKTWTLIRDGESSVRRSSIRLYLPHQVAELVAGAGFAVEGTYAGTDREPLGVDALRCVVVGRRPR